MVAAADSAAPTPQEEQQQQLVLVAVRLAAAAFLALLLPHPASLRQRCAHRTSRMMMLYWSMQTWWVGFGIFGAGGKVVELPRVQCAVGFKLQGLIDV